MGILLKPSARSLLIPLGLTAAVSATDPAIDKNVWFWFYNINNF